MKTADRAPKCPNCRKQTEPHCDSKTCPSWGKCKGCDIVCDGKGRSFTPAKFDMGS